MRYSKNKYHSKVGIIFCFSCLLFFVACAGCRRGMVKKTGSQVDSIRFLEIIEDTNFIKGIGLQGTSSAQPGVEEILSPFGKNAYSPSWTLAQWGSKYDLNGAQPQKEVNGSITYSNVAKSINFWHTEGTTQVSLEVFASKEYEAPRKVREDWPSLLLGQDFQRKVFLTQIKELKLRIKARLMFVENKMDSSTYNPTLHTAQYTLYFSIQNLNKDSKGYGDYLWFGLPFYDYRYKNIAASWKKDDGGSTGGTGKFIYALAGKDLYKGSFDDEQWENISLDLYPYVKDAFQKAKENGYLKNSDFNDMAVSGMNIGWEMPGTFDAGLQFKGFSLTAVLLN